MFMNTKLNKQLLVNNVNLEIKYLFINIIY